MKTDWEMVLTMAIGCCALIAVVALARSCHQLTQETMRRCMESHPALECEKAVHL